MRCFIAIDSGGTKTDAVLFEETGHILARSLTQGCNAMDIGIGSACESLLGVLQNLVARIPRDGTLVSIYSGVAATDYFGGELGRYIRPYFPDVTMRFEDDAVNLISGTLGHQDGCCIISGTGSSLYARIGERIVHLGGWGYLIDTGGSGYAIGRDAILAVFRYCDGRAPYTRLYDLIQEQMGMPPEKMAVKPHQMEKMPASTHPRPAAAMLPATAKRATMRENTTATAAISRGTQMGERQASRTICPAERRRRGLGS